MAKKMHPAVRDIYKEILEFLEQSGMDRTTFGNAALRDGNFLYRIENGRLPTLTTLDKVRRYLDRRTKALNRKRA